LLFLRNAMGVYYSVGWPDGHRDYNSRREEVNMITGEKTQPTREKRIAALLKKLFK